MTPARHPGRGHVPPRTGLSAPPTRWGRGGMMPMAADSGTAEFGWVALGRARHAAQ
jgi:hypothetical protein